MTIPGTTLQNLCFGTSGLRDTVTALSAPVCYSLAQSFARTCAAGAKRVVLGHDLRPSSPGMARACMAALSDAGLMVDYVGVLPTPAVAWHALQQGCPALVVTGSHIPFDRNGIKFYDAQGEINKSQELAILAGLRWPADPVSLPALPVANPAAAQAYAQRYLDFFAPDMLRGLRIGLYEHSSAGRDVLADVLQALGATVVRLGRSDAFVPIDTEAVSSEDQALGREWAAQHGLHALLSTDGDADRPLIGDESGRWLRGDVVGVLTARFLGVQTLVTPVSSNTVAEACGHFAQVVRTRIGSPYVVAAMQEALALRPRDTVAGFEANGGFLLMSDVRNTQDAVLRALPTRDALLPMLAVLAQAVQAGCPVSALQGHLPARFTASDRLQNFPLERSALLLAQLSQDPSAWLLRCLGASAALAHVDQTDGVRMRLQSGEFVHLRPSGNAPELRCYAEADSEPRAVALTAQVLAFVRGDTLVV